MEKARNIRLENSLSNRNTLGLFRQVEKWPGDVPIAVKLISHSEHPRLFPMRVEYLRLTERDSEAYFNQTSMRPSSYQMSQPQPGQGLYPQQQIMFMPPPQYSSTTPQVIMPMTATNYTQRMPSPAYQNSMPTTQQGLFQVPQQNTANFAHTHTYNNPPAVFYNQQAKQQNRPPSASGTSGPGQQPTRKLERTVLQIIDPNSGKDIIQELQQARSTPPSLGTLGSHSTPVSGQEHTESEVSTPRSKKEDEDQNTTNAKTSHKMFGTMDLPSPHVVIEESWSRSSSEEDKIKSKNKAHDTSLTVKAEKNKKQNAVHKYKCEEEQCSPISPEGKKSYDRKFLLQQQNAPQSVMKPANLPDIPEIIIEKPSFGPFPRDCADVGNIADFTTGYAWTCKSLSKSSFQGKDAPWRGISQEKNASLSMQKDMSLHPADGCRKDEEQKNKPAKSEDSTLRAKKENQNQKTTKAKTPDKKVGTAGKPLSHVDEEENSSSSSLEKRMPKLENKANVASLTKKTEKNKKQKAALKNKYKEEQCSPISPEGKKRYDRKFLLQQQNAPQSMMKPANLPDIPEIIIEKPSDSEYIQLASRGGTALLGWFRGSIEDGTRSEEGERTHLPINRTLVAQRQSQETWGRHEPERAKTMEKPSTHVLDHMTNQMGSRTRAIVEKYLHLQDLGDSENIQLGPQGGAARLGWFKGSTGGGARSQDGERPNTSGNRFSALSKADKSDDDGSHRGGGRGGFGRPGPPVNHPSQESEREKAIAAARNIIAERPSEERSGGHEPERAKTMEKPSTPVQELTDDQMGSKTHAIMDEYLHIQDVGELYKKVRSILNKLTPQKFQTLEAKMQALKIDTEAHLKNVIDLVFEKAISEPGFGVAYANMCRCLSMFKVPAESKQGDVNFRALLLTRCQREFEKANSSEKEFDSKRKEIEKAATEEEKQQMNEELEYEETKAKRRSLGNMRFIGELFKLKMLTENIMHDCVFKLLRTKDEENLECLCRLLKSIGKELETDKAKPRMDQYFAQMQKIVNEKKLSSRVRFMLQDVIELRWGKWVPRRDDSNPKTIDQIHREVAQEAQDQAIFVQNLPQAKPQKESRGRPSGQPSGPMGVGADGWNTVSRVPLRTDRTIDPTKLKLSKLGDNENIQLGPGCGAARLGWFKGSTGVGGRSQEGERPNTPGNRFSALSKADKSEDNGSHTGGGRGGFGRPGSSVNRPSQESEREKAIAAANTIVAQRPSEERSGGHEPERAKTMEKPSTPVQELTDDQMGSKTRAIIDEYLHIQDVGEAISCIQELSSSSSLHLFVYNALNHVLERSEIARRQTGLLLHDLVKKNVILVDTYVKGLNEVLMFAEDMEMDIPKIWEYFGQLIGPMVQDGNVPLGFLKQVCEPLRVNSKSGILVAEILHDASHREGHEKVARLWAESGLHWPDFVPNDQIDQFLADKKLEFTKVLTNLSTSMPITDIKENMHNIIMRSCSNEEVFDWIEEHVDDPMIKHKHFIHALMSAVCRSAIAVDGKNMMKVDKSKIQRRNNLLQKYLDHQVEFELQALYALQALVHMLGHPPGVLRELFDVLYDEDIISEDAFIQWEKSEDPQEQEGKSMAMKQVVQFFIWLKDAEDEESDCDQHQESSHHCNDGPWGSISQDKLESLLIQKDISLHNAYTTKSPQKEDDELGSKLQSSNQDKDGSGWHISQKKTESISIQKDNTQKQVEDDARKSPQEEEEKGAEEDEGEEEKGAEEVEGEEEQQNTGPRSSHQDKDCSEQSIGQENNESLSIQKDINLNHAEDDARKSTQEEEEGNEVEEEAEEEQNSELQSSHQDKDGSEQSIILEKNKSLLIQRNTNLNQAEDDSRKSQQEEKKAKGQKEKEKNSEISYPNQPSMQPPSYQMVHSQPGQGMYTAPQHMITPQQMMFMPKAHYSSPGTHVRMPLSDHPNHPNMQPTSYLMGQPPAGPEMYGAPQQMTTPQQMTIPQQQQMNTPQQMMFMPLAQYSSGGTHVRMPMLYCPNQCSTYPPSYPMVHPQPGQRFYTAPQEIMFTQPAPYDSDGTHVSMPVKETKVNGKRNNAQILKNNCLLRRDDNNRTSDQIYGKMVQDEQNRTLMLQNLPPDTTRDENKRVEERDEQSVRSLLSGDNAQRIIQPESSSSRKASTKSLEWDVMQLEQEKLKSEIELIKVKYKKIIEEIELLKLQKEFLKLQINSFS